LIFRLFIISLFDHAMTTVLAIRHVPFEDLGLLAPVFEETGASIRYVEAPTADLVALDPAAPDLLVVLGGPIGAYEDADYPFLMPEIALIEARLKAGLPTLGLCLGSQLMARALGARVYKGPAKEIGWSPLTLTEAGRASPLEHLDGRKTAVLHWHGDTFDLPEGATRLASTGICLNQAFSWGGSALALQFHAEAMGGMLESWFVGHTGEIAATDGISVNSLRAETARWTPVLEPLARLFFKEWLNSVGL
jgi:GMP synthase (glutamine-hydrolysing)